MPAISRFYGIVTLRRTFTRCTAATPSALWITSTSGGGLVCDRLIEHGEQPLELLPALGTQLCLPLAVELGHRVADDSDRGDAAGG